MSERITIEKAVQMTGFPAEEIRDWVKSKKIKSYSYRDGEPLIDAASLQNFVSGVKRQGMQKLYLQEIIEDKEEEINEIIAWYDDYIFCLRSLTTVSPLLKIIIAELASFIKDKKARYIFTEITGGARILDVAKHCGMSYDGMCKRYNTIFSHLKSDTRFMLEYHKTITNQELEIERLELENRNLEYELNRLYEKGLKAGLQFNISQSLIHVPLDAAQRLCRPLTDLTLSPYIRKILENLHIETMEDMLRYIETKGLDSLLEIPGFGKLGLEQLKFQLEKHRVLDKNGYSDLYQYIVSDPDMNYFSTEAYKHES